MARLLVITRTTNPEPPELRINERSRYATRVCLVYRQPLLSRSDMAPLEIDSVLYTSGDNFLNNFNSSYASEVHADDVSLYNKEDLSTSIWRAGRYASCGQRPAITKKRAAVEGSRALNFTRAVIARTLEQRVGLINCGPFLICLARRQDYREIFKPIHPVEKRKRNMSNAGDAFFSVYPPLFLFYAWSVIPKLSSLDGASVCTSMDTSVDGNTTTSVLSFMATKADAGRHLSCQAENRIMGTAPIEDGWVLQIQYTPETQIQLGTSLNPNTIREGTDVYFDCLIQAEPSVYKVEWRHQGKALHHNITQGIIISNQSLVLQGVDRKSAGNYTCVGYNTEGDGESSPFYLNVMFAPTCKPNQTKVHGVAKQEKANISCQVDANPPEVQFKWTFNNSAESIDVAAGHIARAGTSSIVSYTPMTELDYGTLLCWASNHIGQQQVPCVYHIIPAGRPDMVHNCTTSNTSTNSFSVRCTEGFNGGLPQSFLLEVRESNSQELRANLTSPVPRFSVTHLESGALYQACIYAYNDKGRSEAMVVQAGTLRLPEKQLTSESERPRQHDNLTPMLSVTIGVVMALIIVAVIVMVVLRIQHTHVEEQNKSQMEDHAKQTKAVPIQRELRFREGCSLLADEKHPSSPFRKLETSGDLSESDEKNPDIIPQQITGDEPSEYLRKRRLVSTIETSPSRSLLEHSTVTSISGHSSYVGYCTIRNGMPLHEFSNLSTKHKSFQPMVGDVYESGMCTLPRQHWPSQSVQSMSMTMSPPILYAGLGVVTRTCPSGTLPTKDCETRVPGQCCPAIQTQKDTTIGTPVVMAKRESSV
ncbi:Protein turtle-like protein A [Acromyrmex echinatior]|uniref:Protein turtle-like protein A n=1 Tax=Acromyrmex echinatior TaxID=103372 RepID=F4WHZ2_ACREC|nr:Protein turtle-like protein A [Acromyrmex echinatior]